MFKIKSGNRIVSALTTLIFGLTTVCSTFASLAYVEVPRSCDTEEISVLNNDNEHLITKADSYSAYKELVSTYSLNELIPSYSDYRSDNSVKYPNKTIEIDASKVKNYEDAEGKAYVELLSDYDGLKGDSILLSENALAEYEFVVTEEGFYDMSLLYYPVEGKGSDIQRAFFIDGELPYKEMALVNFSRIWTIEKSNNDNSKWNKDNRGNDLKPHVNESPEWTESYLYDSNGYISDNLKVYLTVGKHTLSVLSIREPMLLNKITFSNQEDISSYSQVKAAYDSMGINDVIDETIVIEGEDAVKTSSQMLYPKQDQSSPAVFPSSPRLLLNNAIGGTSWQDAGEWIEWEFEVNEDGYYNVALYDKQNFLRGMDVSRKITIDGKVPFEEMLHYGFSYGRNWKMDILSDENGEAYRFYLTKGTHTIRMEVVLGEFSDVINEVQNSVQELNGIYRQVIRITGVSPDKYRDYQITASLPELENELTAVRDNLDVQIDRLSVMTGNDTDKLTVLITMRDQLNELIYDQERFTEVISTYKINVRALGNWISQVNIQPLELDRIYIYSPESKPKVKNANWFMQIIYEIQKLFFSFIVDYNQVGNVADGKDGEVITLWIGTGRDQANIIKGLIDEEFTPKTGINVNVQLVDMSTLLKASLAGQGPDVAFQVGPTQVATSQVTASMVSNSNDAPVNYGVRNAVLDLTTFEDFDEVSERFSDSAMVPYRYGNACYALPDTQSFPMMFYRKDILKEIGLSVPKSWDDVKVSMSVLSKNQMEFGMLPSEQTFAMILYQEGGRYYNDDGTASDLDSDIAVAAFKDYCEFYTDYRLDKETSLEERFRTGECPIIIADYTTYNVLCVSAPDIEGLWGFAEVPGVTDIYGNINHSTGSIGLADMIMADTEHKQACWELLKWWTSADVQTRYGREMEGLMGEGARVATANTEALSNLSWPVDDYNALMKQFEMVKGIPQVPGGYYTWRNVNNAFYTITTRDRDDNSGSTPREELMQNVQYINAEITYKREELWQQTN